MIHRVSGRPIACPATRGVLRSERLCTCHRSKLRPDRHVSSRYCSNTRALSKRCQHRLRYCRSRSKIRNLQRLCQVCRSDCPDDCQATDCRRNKASYSWLVVLDNDFATSVEYPCILQEYVNHNAEWFKVYVLGNHISVHQRPSLPDLPRDATTNKSVVAFDSQLPYSTLRHFGYGDERTTSTSKGG